MGEIAAAVGEDLGQVLDRASHLALECVRHDLSGRVDRGLARHENEIADPCRGAEWEVRSGVPASPGYSIMLVSKEG